jgi:hypothetical protein
MTDASSRLIEREMSEEECTVTELNKLTQQMLGGKKIALSQGENMQVVGV